MRAVGMIAVFVLSLVSIVEAVPGPDGLGPRLLLEAAEKGWWYSAPIPGRRLVVAFLTAWGG